MASHNDNDTLDAPMEMGGKDKTMSVNNRIDVALTAKMKRGGLPAKNALTAVRTAAASVFNSLRT